MQLLRAVVNTVVAHPVFFAARPLQVTASRSQRRTNRRSAEPARLRNTYSIYNDGRHACTSAEREKLSAVKLHASQYIVALVLLVLAIGLWRLQVLGADNYRVLAEENRIRKVPVLAPRGKIFDREGRILVDNYPSVSCYLLRDQVKDLDADLPLIARGLDIPVEQIQATSATTQLAPKYQPIPLKQDITPDEQAFIEAHRNELPELETLDEQRRLYPRDGFAAHLIGYVGEVSEQDLNNSKLRRSTSPATWSASPASRRPTTRSCAAPTAPATSSSTATARRSASSARSSPSPGTDLRLTIDLDIQRPPSRRWKARTAPSSRWTRTPARSSPWSRAPPSTPTSSPSASRSAYWNQIINDPNHPLLNKTIQAQLAPGSTFKIIMSLAGLQENVAQTMHVDCNGGATFYGHFFACDKHHGMVDIHHAIPWSCDTFYYTLANKLGIDTIAKYATSVGLSQKTGIDLPDEAAGIMPSTAWKLKTQHEKWYAGETISVGIGQGAIAGHAAAARPRPQRHRLRRRPAPPARRLPRRGPAETRSSHRTRPSPAPATRPSRSPPTTGRSSPTPWPTSPRPPAPPPQPTWKASTSPARPAPPRS